MVHLNVRKSIPTVVTHEGARARVINAEAQLRRSVNACLLWERTFYEDGVDIAERIRLLAAQVDPEVVSRIAIEARTAMSLRHAPLWLAVGLAAREDVRGTEKAHLIKDTFLGVIRRADEPVEALAMWWKDGKRPVPKQMKLALGESLRRFDAYQLAKYDRPGTVRLRDVLFLTHPKPNGPEQEALWKNLAEQTLSTPDTWEVALSAGKDKRATWERLMTDGMLGGMALLRNLRNMREAGVERDTVRGAISGMKTGRILPYRFIAAAKAAPEFEPELEGAMFRSVAEKPKLAGETVLLVDISYSMEVALSSIENRGKRQGQIEPMSRIDAASAITMIAREMCESVVVATFSKDVAEVAPRRGFALRDAIWGSQQHSYTYLGNAVRVVRDRWPLARLIVLTDEQSNDPVPDTRGYMINVSTNKNGVGYRGGWNHIDGFSAAVLDYIRASDG